MKKILFTLLVFFTLASCTQNNGRIGDLFGLWKVESVEIDGVPDKDYPGTLFFAFQNDVVGMCETLENHESYWTYGQYFRDGGNIDMYFDMQGYAPLKISHFQTGLNACKIYELNGNKFVFSTVIEDAEYRYRLKKWD